MVYTGFPIKEHGVNGITVSVKDLKLCLGFFFVCLFLRELEQAQEGERKGQRVRKREKSLAESTLNVILTQDLNSHPVIMT